MLKSACTDSSPQQLERCQTDHNRTPNPWTSPVSCPQRVSSHRAAQELEGASSPSFQGAVVWSSGARVCFAACVEVWMIRPEGKKGLSFWVLYVYVHK